MVHPTELLRINSNEGREFSAPRNVVQNQLDCGLTNLPILNRCCNLERFAEPKVFLVFLSLVGFIQGITLTYFRDTSVLWGQHYNVAQENIEWLIYTNEFFVGFFALFVSFYGNKVHRASWIGGLTIFQAIASGTLTVPEIYRRGSRIQVNSTDLLCLKESLPSPPEIEVNYIALGVIAIFQIFFAMASVSFISHGITYLDDNTSHKHSPGYIGIALACKELGKQAGLYFSWIPIFLKVDGIFVSPMWLSITLMIFISGMLIAMFPRNMPSVLMRTLSASIIDFASGNEVSTISQPIDGFFKTLWRLLTNKVLMVNILCLTLLQSGLINFNIFEKHFNQSSFQIAHINDNSYTQFATNILKQPLVALTLVATGMIIAKSKPQLKSLVKWNIIVLILVIIFFSSTAFLKCEPRTKYLNMLNTPFCARACSCSFDVFSPVCVSSTTYYSPCFAGCAAVKEENSKHYYSNCSCAATQTPAREGPCNVDQCDLFYALSQVNRVITTALLSSTIVTNLMINMRCILSRDKATALGLDATFTSLIPYLPVKAIYGAIADKFCIFSRDDKLCRLYSRNLSTFLSISTITLMLGSLILSVVVLLFLKYSFNLPKENNDSDEEDEGDENVEFQNVQSRPNMMSRDETDFRRNGKRYLRGSEETIPDSLLEMEDVGDDHDSIDSGEYLDEIPERSNQRRVMESDL